MTIRQQDDAGTYRPRFVAPVWRINIMLRYGNALTKELPSLSEMPVHLTLRPWKGYALSPDIRVLRPRRARQVFWHTEYHPSSLAANDLGVSNSMAPNRPQLKGSR